MFPLRQGGEKIKKNGMQIIEQEAKNGNEDEAKLMMGEEKEIKVGQKFSKLQQKH